MSELRPCPFCGKEVFLLDVAIQPAPDAKWDVYCRTHDCFLNSGTNNMFSNREDAIIAWNTRSDAYEIIALREQVKVLQETLDKAAEVADYLHRACLNPSRPRQAIGEMANYLLNTLIAALKQTKPKDSEEVKL